jgi:TonB family protein
MTQHLNDRQIAQWVLGQRSSAERGHLRECGTCSLELNALQDAFEGLGTALRGEADSRAASRNLTIAGLTPSVSSEELFTSGYRLDAPSPSSGYSRALSLALHATLVVLLIVPVVFLDPSVSSDTSVMVWTQPLSSPVFPEEKMGGGGGGGGTASTTPPSRGLPPRGADKQLVPPMMEPKNLMPELVAESTIVAPQMSQLAPFDFNSIGDPNGVVGPPSGGPGTGGGVGTGQGRGVGDGRGPGLGPGEGGGNGNGIFNVGGGVTAPRIRTKIDPEYSEDGRKARAQGTVQLLVIVRETGKVEVVDVIQRLGHGLDQKAIDAVAKWIFEPAERSGAPVAVYISVFVNFSLR